MYPLVQDRIASYDRSYLGLVGFRIKSSGDASAHLLRLARPTTSDRISVFRPGPFAAGKPVRGLSALL